MVRRTDGDLVKGDVLVSNFNNSQNQQGTGSSIVEVSPSGQAHVFAVVPAPMGSSAVGLTTALVTLRDGFVVVGNLPAPMGMSSNATAGALTILDSRGNVVSTYIAPDINGPWDMTAVDQGKHATLFVTNVLNGTVAAGGMVVHHGTVVRLELSIAHGAMVPQVTSNTVIATGFGEHTDPNALVVGPTGVGLGHGGVLYVADSNANRIAAVPDALTRTSTLGGGGMTVSKGGALNDPLGLTIAPGGDVLSANGADGNFVETSPGGQAGGRQAADRKRRRRPVRARDRAGSVTASTSSTTPGRARPRTRSNCCVAWPRLSADIPDTSRWSDWRRPARALRPRVPQRGQGRRARP